MSLTASDADWSFWNKTSYKSYPANVPSTFHLDLLDNKLVQDPYYRENLLDYYKYELEEWVYSSTFFLSADFSTRKMVEISFEGLDTHAQIQINGNLVGNTDNAHRTWIFPLDGTTVKFG